MRKMQPLEQKERAQISLELGRAKHLSSDLVSILVYMFHHNVSLAEVERQYKEVMSYKINGG